MKRTLRQTPRFVREAKRYLKKHPDAALLLAKLLSAMADDIHAPALKTHRLKGELAGVLACSGGYDLRILFDLQPTPDGEEIVLLTIGTRDDVY